MWVAATHRSSEALGLDVNFLHLAPDEGREVRRHATQRFVRGEHVNRDLLHGHAAPWALRDAFGCSPARAAQREEHGDLVVLRQREGE